MTGILFASVMMIFAGVLSNCGDNGDGGTQEPASLAGKYIFTKAVLTSDLTIEDKTDGSTAVIELKAGYDVTNMVVGGLVGAVQCDNMNNGAINLDPSYKLYAFCNGEDIDPMEGGTWSENSTRTELTLNLAPPLVPFTVTIKETDIVVNGNNLSGKVTDMPMSGLLLKTYLPADEVPDGFIFPIVVQMDVQIDYTKIN
jgi:hypothetical protein